MTFEQQSSGVQAVMVLCVVYGCSKRSGRDKDVSFFRIPRVISNKGEEVCGLSKKRKEKFFAAISRVGLTEKILKNDRICSRHYLRGKPSDLLDETNPDWLPTLHLGHSKSGAMISTVQGRYERRKARVAAKNEETAARNDVIAHNQDIQVGSNNTQYNSSNKNQNGNEMFMNLLPATADSSSQTVDAEKSGIEVSTQTDCSENVEQIEQMKITIENLIMRVSPAPFSETFVNDDIVKFYTGLPNLKVLNAIYRHVLSGIHDSGKAKLKLFQEFISVLMKLRLNSPMQDLAYRFQVSVSTISRIFLMDFSHA